MDSSDKPTVLLEYYLKRLKLATMLKEYAAVAKLCGQERADYLIFLLRLAEREALRREQRAAERRILAANFPVIRVIDTFDFKAQPSINEPLIRELMRGEYVGRKENVLLVGNSGNRQDASGLGPGVCGLLPRPQGSLLYRDGSGHRVDGKPG